jgi:hypothetical protein
MLHLLSRERVFLLPSLLCRAKLALHRRETEVGMEGI